MSVLTDPNVQAALKAVDADQQTLATDTAAQTDAAAALAMATTTKAAADQTVASDAAHLTTDTLALYSILQTSTGVPFPSVTATTGAAPTVPPVVTPAA